MSANKKRIILPFIIVLIAIGVMTQLMGLKKPPEKKVEEEKALLVETIKAEKRPFQFSVESQGTVMPKIDSTMVAQVSGKILSISSSFVKGGFFKAGDVLVEIESADYQTALKTAQANLARAKATLAEERARSKVAENEWNQFMEGKAPDLYIRKPQLAREVANVQAAEADVERAQRNLQRTKITAQFNGIVRDKLVDIGQYVNMGAPLANLYGTDVAEVRLPVSDHEMSFMSFKSAFDIQTMKPQVRFSALSSNNNWLGTLVRTEGIVDDSNRLIYLVAEVNDPYRLDSSGVSLEFGRFVKASIAGETLNSVVVVDRDYVREGNQVLLVKNNSLSIENVEIKKLDQNNAYIISGVEHGDNVVTTNLKNPMHGTKVKVIELSSNANQGATP